jgi:hypothetical protein
VAFSPETEPEKVRLREKKEREPSPPKSRQDDCPPLREVSKEMSNESPQDESSSRGAEEGAIVTDGRDEEGAREGTREGDEEANCCVGEELGRRVGEEVEGRA